MVEQGWVNFFYVETCYQFKKKLLHIAMDIKVQLLRLRAPFIAKDNQT